jgi:membrane-associated phospholipid phosphatase
MSLAAPFMSTVLALAGCAMLALRGRRDRALLWASVFVAGFVLEVLGKLFVVSSFPSGHAMRALLLAGLASELWPRRRRWFWGFAAFVILGVQLKAIHPPSDIAGGILAAAMLLFLVSAVGQKPSWSPRSQSSRT